MTRLKPVDQERFYIRHNQVMRVTTCKCCRVAGMQDAWFCAEGELPVPMGVSKGYVKNGGWIEVTLEVLRAYAKQLGVDIFPGNPNFGENT